MEIRCGAGCARFLGMLRGEGRDFHRLCGGVGRLKSELPKSILFVYTVCGWEFLSWP